MVALTLDFYKRNYIEGLFLSSGIIRNGDYTMEQVIEVARSLREDHTFAGYIHLKTIPDASPDLLALAGRYADRLSINVELPTETGLAKLAPEKKLPDIRAAMGNLRWRIDEGKQARRDATKLKAKPPRFAPAGQSTQMIVGADAANDGDILRTSSQSVRQLSPAPRLLLGVQSDSRCVVETAAAGAAAGTRASAVSGRLAAALLRVRRRRNHAADRQRHARSGHRSEDWRGRCGIRSVFRSM